MKSIIFCFLTVAIASYAEETSKDHLVGLLDDLELSRWDVPAPEIVLQSKKNVAGPTNVTNKSYLSAELSGMSEGKWKVQMYETIKKEMYVQDKKGMRWLAESALTPPKQICNRRVLVGLNDNEVRYDTAIHVGRKYILAQLEYADLDLILGGDKYLDGPYVKKKVYLASDARSVAIAMSVVGAAIDTDKKSRAPTVTMFFEIQGDELIVAGEKCSTGDLIYSFANIDSEGNLVAYFGFDGYHAVVRCDKADILRYSAIISKGL